MRSGALGNEKAAPQLMDLVLMIGNACKDRKSLDTAYNSMIDMFDTLVPKDDPGHCPTTGGSSDKYSSNREKNECKEGNQFVKHNEQNLQRPEEIKKDILLL